MSFPPQSKMELPLLKVLSDLGGSAEPKDVYDRVAKFFPDLTEEELVQGLPSNPSNRKWTNRVQWVRQRLVESGDLDGSERGTWRITDKGRGRLEKSPPAKENSVEQIPEMPLAENFEAVFCDYADIVAANPKTSNPDYRQLQQRLKECFAPILEHFDLSINTLGGMGMARSSNPYVSLPYRGHKTSLGIYPVYFFDLDNEILSLHVGDSDDNPPPPELVSKLSGRLCEILPDFELRNADGYPRKEIPRSQLDNVALNSDLLRIVMAYEEVLLEYATEINAFLRVKGRDALDDTQGDLRVESSIDRAGMEESKVAAYSLEQCSDATGLPLSTLDEWVRAVERKGQGILYGPPGTGKTFVAQHLARHLVGGGDGFIELVQFHPSYSYEEFIEGIRPRAAENGGLDYPVVPGRFLDFCWKAARRTGRCVLIVDEINRANLSRVFGELMYLLEYRDETVALSSGTRFRIPSNVRLLGTMNTADRSIAMVDHALRRRFSFLPLYPNYDVLQRFHAENGVPVERLIDVLQALNREIGDKHYEVGISFFLHRHLMDYLPDIWRMEIEPYLEEYFFDKPERADKFSWESVKSRLKV